MSEPEPGFPTEGDVDAVLDEFDGDARDAIRALLSDLAALAADLEGSVSRGYVRGQTGRTIVTTRRSGD